MAKDLQFSLLLDLYGTLLTAHQREVAVSYYHYDLSLQEIAENRNVSRQAVMDALRKGQDALVRFEESLGLHARRTKERTRIKQALDLIDADPNAARDILTEFIEDRN